MSSTPHPLLLYQPSLFTIIIIIIIVAMHLLKILSIFCTAQVLLPCVKSGLPPMRSHLEVDRIRYLMLCVFTVSNHLFPCPTVTVNFDFSLSVLFDRQL